MRNLKILQVLLRPFTTIKYADEIKAQANQRTFNATVTTEVKKPQHVNTSLPVNSGKRISLYKRNRMS